MTGMSGLIELLIAATAGLVVTVVLNLLLPKRAPRWARSAVPPLVGVGLAYAIIELV